MRSSDERLRIVLAAYTHGKKVDDKSPSIPSIRGTAAAHRASARSVSQWVDKLKGSSEAIFTHKVAKLERQVKRLQKENQKFRSVLRKLSEFRRHL